SSVSRPGIVTDASVPVSSTWKSESAPPYRTGNPDLLNKLSSVATSTSCTFSALSRLQAVAASATPASDVAAAAVRQPRANAPQLRPAPCVVREYLDMALGA